MRNLQTMSDSSSDTGPGTAAPAPDGTAALPELPAALKEQIRATARTLEARLPAGATLGAPAFQALFVELTRTLAGHCAEVGRGEQRGRVDLAAACLAIETLAVPALAFSSPQVAKEAEDSDRLTAGAVVLFADRSFLWFGDPEDPLPAALDADGRELDFGLSFQIGDGLTPFGASAGFAARYGAPAEWQAGLGDEVDIDYAILDEIAERVADAIDPPFDAVEESDFASWDHDHASRIEALALDVWLALDVPSPAEINLHANPDGQAGAAHIQVFVIAEAVRRTLRNPTAAVETILDALDDIDAFEGGEWIYNDGASDRRSGYDWCAREVFCIEIDPAAFSAHERLAARTRIAERLAAAGIDTPRRTELLSAFAPAA